MVFKSKISLSKFEVLLGSIKGFMNDAASKLQS